MVTSFPQGTAAKQTTSMVMMHVIEHATQMHYLSLGYKVVFALCKVLWCVIVKHVAAMLRIVGRLRTDAIAMSVNRQDWPFPYVAGIGS